MLNTKITKDSIIATLDAGGTNFYFSAFKDGKSIFSFNEDSPSDQESGACVDALVNGFEKIKANCGDISAISFSFPGPADYRNGLIRGNLPNFPSLRAGAPLGAILKNHFNVPVFINNDASLFVYGEYFSEKCEALRKKLQECNAENSNLIGYTLGTGLGFGFVSNGKLHNGNNFATETFCIPAKADPSVMIEEYTSAKFFGRNYSKLTGCKEIYTPLQIEQIAKGKLAGDPEAALQTYKTFGENLGYAMSLSMTMIDAPVVIGGGIAKGREMFMPAVMEEIRSNVSNMAKNYLFARVPSEVYDLDEPEEAKAYFDKIENPQNFGEFNANNSALCVFVSDAGATTSVCLGACMYATETLKDLYQ